MIPRSSYRHLPGLFRPEQLRALRARLDDRAGSQAAEGERERAALARGESSDALRKDPAWYQVWRDPDARLLEAIRPFTWVVYPVQVRIVRALTHRVPWHQDIGYQQLLATRGHERIVTCFIPLDEDPANRTTLEFARMETGALVHEPADGFGAGLPRRSFEQTDSYRLALGDCLFFGDLAVHRTFVPPGANVERRSLEFRLVEPGDSLAEKDYFDIERGLFVRKDGSTRSAP